MRLVTKGWVAVPAMVDLAMRVRPMKRAEICARHRISEPFVDQLFGRLRRSGLVKSMRGRAGGYWLAQDVARISVADIIIAVDGRTKSQTISRHRHPAYRVSHGVWSKLTDNTLGYLRTVTLQQLVRNAERARTKRPPDKM